MRQIIFDTETTGFKPEEGHRLVEIGAIEMIRGAVTGQQFHCYINPERDMPDGAFKVHGLSSKFLSDKPVFADPQIGQAFMDFVQDAELIAHNAPFDMGFMQYELKQASLPLLTNKVIDTLPMARKKFPGAPASLDALCARFGISTNERERDGHGALLDSKLLAKVYIELTGGVQAGLNFVADENVGGEAQQDVATILRQRPLKVIYSKEEEKAHQSFIAEMTDPIWDKYC
ncbi:MAG: DNA polymerase III subunit epsilon [bacterium]